MSRNRSSRPNEELGEFVCIKWCDDNKYSTLVKSKLPVSAQGIEGKDLVGKSYQIKWSDGRSYTGEVVSYGSKAEMLLEEENLEKLAADISIQAAEDEHSSIPDHFFALVHWRDDDKLSVLSSSKLKISDTWNGEENLAGSSGNGNWKGSWLPVTVLATGSKVAMKRELRSRVSDGASSKKRRSEVENGLDENSEVGSQLGVVMAEQEENDKDVVIAELREELADCKRKLASEEARCKKLRRMLNKQQKQQQGSTNDSEEVDIGGGLSIPKSVDDYVKFSFPTNPMKFLKNLLVKGGIFSLEELATHSLKGGKSPKVPSEARDMLDPAKLKAAFDYTVSCLRLKDEPLKLMKFESNLKDLCTNARKELKNRTK